jgi:hypothetical protein
MTLPDVKVTGARTLSPEQQNRSDDEEDHPMTSFGAFAASAVFAMLVVSPVYAQQPGASQGQHHPESQAATSTTLPAATPDMKAGGMPMMDMCRQMMGDMMRMQMMSGAAPADPKEKADMLEMRGEMMKAMGDVMMKHARRMQGMKGK